MNARPVPPASIKTRYPTQNARIPRPYTCAACAAGKYKDEVSDAECTDCDVNSLSLEGSTAVEDCHCKAGFTGANGTVCLACAAGKHKAAPGDRDCASCPANTFSGIAAEACVSCPVHSQASPESTRISDCMCTPGYERVGDECLPCEHGYYKTLEGNMLCLPCPAMTFQNQTAQSSCLACMHNAASETASTAIEQCACNAGFRAEMGGCVSCEPGTYKDTVQNTECVDCPVDSFLPDYGSVSVDQCAACPADSSTYDATGASNASQCMCVMGYERVSDACMPCRYGSYCTGMDSITACTRNSSTLQTGATNLGDCVCDAGYYRSDKISDCIACTFDFYCVGDETRTPCVENSTSASGSTSLLDCVCLSGFKKIDM